MNAAIKTYVDFTQKPQRIISFCPGIRGLERGLERVNRRIQPLAYVEIEAFPVQNLVAAMEARVLGPAPIWTDARTFPAHIFSGKVNGILAGYPCQGESTAGLRELENYAGYLWPAIRSGFKAIKPVWGFFENVDDHLSGTFQYVLNDLREMGYAVEAGIYTAQEVGAPHERQRLFILAVENAYFERMRRGDNSAENGECEIQAQGSGELADAGSFPRGQSESKRRIQNSETRWGGEELADTTDQGFQKSERTESGQPSKASKELADTDGKSDQRKGRRISEQQRQGGKGEFTGQGIGLTDSGENKLADADNLGAEGIGGKVQGPSTGIEGTAQGQNGKWDGARPGNGGEDVDNADRIGHQSQYEIPAGRHRLVITSKKLVNSEGVGFKGCQWDESGSFEETDEPYQGCGTFGAATADRFPAGQGEEQYQWEEPRTIESGLGCTANGYNFREDLLRAFGNSVLEQVSEVAFIDLLNTHIEKQFNGNPVK